MPRLVSWIDATCPSGRLATVAPFFAVDTLAPLGVLPALQPCAPVVAEALPAPAPVAEALPAPAPVGEALPAPAPVAFVWPAPAAGAWLVVEVVLRPGVPAVPPGLPAVEPAAFGEVVVVVCPAVLV